MADTPHFASLVPGFDFLQGLVKNAGAALPHIGQWVSPTLNPEELEKRIQELRTVQFWLEQNARMLGTTIQALEVQRMTLSTLKTMNVQMDDLRDSLKIKVPTPSPPPPPPAWPAPEPVAPPAAAAGSKAENKTDNSDGTAAPAAVDPMQWWGALTQQFTQLATTAMKESASDAAKTLADTLARQTAAATAAATTVANVATGAAAAAPAAAPKPASAAKKTAVKRAPRKTAD